ncbi:DUF2474 domain-containing protein [Rhizosaccharibacter radicis]|uniref:DUF2474 domain-containing protein n=1 Tax=Rhizosaccharibacter radicis TaxID=2782605 RepID=A0ABT1W0Q7_9PROT|nr:DUF2474 domain-containing protein [Acetobacteraceae bacterium KSS12]
MRLEPRLPAEPRPGGFGSRIGWFVLIWFVSLCAVVGVAHGLRMLIPH